jgi:glutathione S-transferase
MDNPASPILHHYELSPFARKVRAVFGYKGIAWGSCLVPRQPPRPELAAVLGAFRRIPIMQQGADFICDSNLALRVLERRRPERSIYAPSDALSDAVSQWFEPRMFTVFSPLRFRTPEDVKEVFASDEERRSFVLDRAPFMAPMADISKNAENVPTAAAHAHAFARWIETRLAGNDFLQGAEPTHADFSAWHPWNWIKGKSAHHDFFQGYTRLWTWVDRIAAFHEATRMETPPAQALALAHEGRPVLEFPNAPLPGDPAPGSRVAIAPNDYGIDSAEGDLVSISANHISIRRQTVAAGTVGLHFPRWGYRILMAAS